MWYSKILIVVSAGMLLAGCSIFNAKGNVGLPEVTIIEFTGAVPENGSIILTELKEKRYVLTVKVLVNGAFYILNPYGDADDKQYSADFYTGEIKFINVRAGSGYKIVAEIYEC